MRLLLLLRTRTGLGLLALAVLAGWALHTRGLLSHYEVASSLTGSAIYFAVGIASRVFFPALRALRLAPMPIALRLAAVSIVLLRAPLAIGL